MKIGDLVKFRLRYADADHDWFSPAVVLGRYPNGRDGSRHLLWIVWCAGLRCAIDEYNYEVELLSE